MFPWNKDIFDSRTLYKYIFKNKKHFTKKIRLSDEKKITSWIMSDTEIIELVPKYPGVVVPIFNLLCILSQLDEILADENQVHQQHHQIGVVARRILIAVWWV